MDAAAAAPRGGAASGMAEDVAALTAAAATFVRGITASCASRSHKVDSPNNDDAAGFEVGASPWSPLCHDVSDSPRTDCCSASPAPRPVGSTPPPACRTAETPSTDAGPWPSPGPSRLSGPSWTSGPSRTGMLTPLGAPRSELSTSLPQGPDSLVDSMLDAEATPLLEVAASPASGMDALEIAKAVPLGFPELFAPSPPMTGQQGARRPCHGGLRRASLPDLRCSSLLSTSQGTRPETADLPSPVLSQQSAQPATVCDLMCAQLSARQFVAQIVLGRVLAGVGGADARPVPAPVAEMPLETLVAPPPSSPPARSQAGQRENTAVVVSEGGRNADAEEMPDMSPGPVSLASTPPTKLSELPHARPTRPLSARGSSQARPQGRRLGKPSSFSIPRVQRRQTFTNDKASEPSNVDTAAPVSSSRAKQPSLCEIEGSPLPLHRETVDGPTKIGSRSGPNTAFKSKAKTPAGSAANIARRRSNLTSDASSMSLLQKARKPRPRDCFASLTLERPRPSALEVEDECEAEMEHHENRSPCRSPSLQNFESLGHNDTLLARNSRGIRAETQPVESDIEYDDRPLCNGQGTALGRTVEPLMVGPYDWQTDDDASHQVDDGEEDEAYREDSSSATSLTPHSEHVKCVGTPRECSELAQHMEVSRTLSGATDVVSYAGCSEAASDHRNQLIWDGCGGGYVAELEATLSGMQLGQLLTRPSCEHVLSAASPPLTVALDDATAHAIYAAVGGLATLQTPQPAAWHFHEDLAAANTVADVVVVGQEARDPNPSHNRPWTCNAKRTSHDMHDAERDLVVVHTRGGSTGAASPHLPEHEIHSELSSCGVASTHPASQYALAGQSGLVADRDAVPTDASRANSAVAAVTASAMAARTGTTTGLQVRSVKLLKKLPEQRDRACSSTPPITLSSGKVRGPLGRRLCVVGSRTCSPEWHDSALHRDCLRDLDSGHLDDRMGGLDVGAAGEVLPVRWERMRGRIETLWNELQVAIMVREEMRAGPFASITPDSVYRLEMHLHELLEFRIETKRIVFEWLRREAVLDAVKRAHALALNDARLGELREDLSELDRLSVSIVRMCGAWSRRFGHLAVDVTKLTVSLGDGPTPHAAFLWAGRDVVERVQTETEALCAGRPFIGDFAGGGEKEAGGNCGNPGESVGGLGSWLEKGGRAPLMPETGALSASQSPSSRPLAPLVSSVITHQRFKVSDVLHDGPSPPWYHPRIARAGIKAMRRGVPCGGRDKRL